MSKILYVINFSQQSMDPWVDLWYMGTWIRRSGPSWSTYLWVRVQVDPQVHPCSALVPAAHEKLHELMELNPGARPIKQPAEQTLRVIMCFTSDTDGSQSRFDASVIQPGVMSGWLITKGESQGRSGPTLLVEKPCQRRNERLASMGQLKEGQGQTVCTMHYFRQYYGG
ncbi:hypothetical protein BC629DRAFT_1444015 [Irpex lacteus]|nr:hypothetical protein BC629DRAFT_1444015 [Irpex lacteus]